MADDRRGISDVLPYLPPDFVERAAVTLFSSTGPVLIVTGFYVAGTAETDGPPGAVAVGNAVLRLGRAVYYVTDRHAVQFLGAIAADTAPVLEVAVTDRLTSQAACQHILQALRPGLLIAIERCGQTRDGRYLNTRGDDISDYTAKLDYLFDGTAPSIGIGDGGNEIGMGSLYEAVRASGRLAHEPAVAKVDHLIIASVSNWGAYGLVAALTRLSGQDLLPTQEEAELAIRRIVDLGAVDGLSARPAYSVDGFTLAENLRKLERLRAFARPRGAARP